MKLRLPQNSVSVVPAKAGIQSFQPHLDSRLRGNDGLLSILRESQLSFLLILPLLLIIGCARFPCDAGFKEVHRSVQERTGISTEWNVRLDDDGDVAQSVREMFAHDLTGDDAVQIALLNNRHVQAVYEELGIACADLVQAGLLSNPVFDGSARWAAGSSPAIELGVAQNFLSVFSIPLRRRVASAEFEEAKSRVTAAILDMAWETRTVFHHFQAATSQLEMHRKMLETAEASYEVVKRLHKAGNITALDLAREQAIFEEVKMLTALAELTVQDGHERLNVLMGLYGKDTTWKASPMPGLPTEEMDLAHVEGRAIEASLDVEIARNAAVAAAQRLGISRVERLFEHTGVGADIQREESEWSAGPSLEMSIPIFDWGQGKIPAAQASLRRQWRDYVATAVEVRSAARAARNRLISARHRVEYSERVILPLSEKITAETLLEYNAMQIGPVQILEAKIAETEARRQGVEALRDYWIARAGMEQVLNGRIPREFFSGGPGIGPPGASAQTGDDH